MRRFLAGFALALVLFPAAVSAGVVTVKNPLQSDLDGGTFAIRNLSQLEAGTVTGTVGFYSGTFAAGGNIGTIQLSDGTGSGPTIFADTRDPTTGINVAVGSLELRRNGTTGELWVKTGPNPADWQRVALAP